MAVPAVLVPKLPKGLPRFNLSSRLSNCTVRQLRVVCRENKVVQRGRKADVVQRLKDKGFDVKPPFWFWWDEIFRGQHALFYVCKNEHISPLSGFNIRPDGVVDPSLDCPDCGYHIWGKLDLWDGGYIGPQAGNNFYWPSDSECYVWFSPPKE